MLCRLVGDSGALLWQPCLPFFHQTVAQRPKGITMQDSYLKGPADLEALRCAGWVTEGVSAFDELSGSAPVSIRQQALRGLAKIALQRNDTVAAKAQV